MELPLANVDRRLHSRSSYLHAQTKFMVPAALESLEQHPLMSPINIETPSMTAAACSAPRVNIPFTCGAKYLYTPVVCPP